MIKILQVYNILYKIVFFHIKSELKIYNVNRSWISTGSDMIDRIKEEKD